MSSLLKEERALAKLREELERRKEKLCRSCKGFRHLARNCRNRKEEEKCKGTPPFLPLNTMTTLQSYLSLFTSDTKTH